MHIQEHWLRVVALSLALSAGPAVGQPAPIDSVASQRIVARAKQYFRGAPGAAPRGNADALADSLVLIALADGRESTMAVIELALAGNGRAGVYAGSVPRLLRVARDSPNDRLANVALAGLKDMLDTTAAVAALAELAMQPRHQRSAVLSLMSFYGSSTAGKTAAIGLHREGKITDELALYLLDRFVRRLN